MLDKARQSHSVCLLARHFMNCTAMISFRLRMYIRFSTKSEIKLLRNVEVLTLFPHSSFYTHESTHPDPVYIKFVLFSPFCHLWLYSYHRSCMDYSEFLQVVTFFLCFIIWLLFSFQAYTSMGTISTVCGGPG